MTMQPAFVTLGNFRATHNDTVTGTAQSWAPNSPYSEFIVMATVDTCLKRQRVTDTTDDGAATTEDFQLQAGVYCRLMLEVGIEQLSWIAASGASDGAIKITEASLP